MATLGFFLILNNFFENPFERYWQLPSGSALNRRVFSPASGATVIDASQTEGQGLNPLLRHFGMVIHPPMLYLGFVGFVIPFAFAFAALATGQLGSSWLRATRALGAGRVVVPGLGLDVGGRWAYDVLGWGGYWGWDPVENCGAAALADRDGLFAQRRRPRKTRDAQVLEYAADHPDLSAGRSWARLPRAAA